MWSGFQLASKTIDIDRPLGDGSKVRVAYQGAPGEFSEAAALKAYPQCEAVPCEQFEVAFKVVELWLVDKAVLPIENSVEGSIHRNYDLLLCHSLHIVGEVQLSINHCLLALPGLKKVDLKRVLSHPQALGQCEIALNKLGVIRESVDDAAVAAQLIALKVLRDAGAIASAQAAEIYGLDILEENMQHVSSRLDDLARQDMITPHPSCANPLITHLAFADDLIIFVEASESNARAIKNVLGSFVEISGLSASTTKSNMHMAGCYGDSMNRIQDIRIGIPIDTLPARFLGVHLIIKQLTYNDCLPLIESIQSHIHSWKAKHLSYMGRLTPYQICSTG